MELYFSDSEKKDFNPLSAAIIATEDEPLLKKKKWTHKHMVTPWIAERYVKNEHNTMFKLQQQMKDVSIKDLS